MEETGILENPALLTLVLPDFEPGRNPRSACSVQGPWIWRLAQVVRPPN